MMTRWGLASTLWLLAASSVFGQPDPRDSIILESRFVQPGAHPGDATDTAAYVYLKVYITNKDTITAIIVPVIERSVSGGAYMTLGHPRNFNGVVSRLTTTLKFFNVLGLHKYNSSSPDSFRIAGVYDPSDLATLEPPNLIRKPFYEIKFDSVWNNAGTVELASGLVIDPPGFVSKRTGLDVPVNFPPAVVTVGQKGDLNLDGQVRASDVVAELRCVFLGETPAAGREACDLNCDGATTIEDVVLFLTYKFITLTWPC